MTYLMLTLFCWVVVSTYWTFSSRGNKEDVYRQNLVIRTLTWSAPIVGYILVYVPPLSVGWLGLRWLPRNSAIGIAGVLICALGLAFAVWARRTLGANWSGTVTLKEDHELVQTGPYGLVRHPIYAGLLLAMLASAMVLGEVRGLIAFTLMGLAFAKKMSDEEALMKIQFPEEYPRYQSRVRKIVPFVF